MTNRSRIAIAGSMLLLILLVALVATNPEMREQTLVEMGLAEASNKTLRATGFLELPTIVLASGTGGRVEAVHIEEGEIVSADESLLSFDKEALLAQRDAASARLSAAQSHLNLLQGGARPADLEVAEIALELAEAFQDAAELALEHASESSRISEAERELEQADATVAAAHAALDELKQGASDEDIAAARAAVEAARAEVAATDYKLAEQDIRSPWKGIVLSIFREAGEWTFPGAPAILLGKTDEFFMDVFVSEDDLASVAVGQQVQIAVESVTQRSFPGLVVKIASEAEFTPRTLQDAEQQNILLYKVEISIEASLDELKPGLIGEVDFGGEA